MGGTGELEFMSNFNPASVLSQGFAVEMRPITKAEKAIFSRSPREFEPEAICGKDDCFQINQTKMI